MTNLESDHLTCVKKYIDIPFAHRAPHHDGHCRFIHGHNWSFEFHFKATELDKNGFVLDFGKLKPLKAMLESLDHSLLIARDDPALTELNEMANKGLAQLVIAKSGTSSEALAKDWHSQANTLLEELGEKDRVTCYKVVVFEDAKNSATYDLNI